MRLPPMTAHDSLMPATQHYRKVKRPRTKNPQRLFWQAQEEKTKVSWEVLLAKYKQDPLNICNSKICTIQTQNYIYNQTYKINGIKVCAGGVVDGKIIAEETIVDEGPLYTVTCTPNEKGASYFYPWVNYGVGYCYVPTNPPKGTLALTYAMNGCVMAVYYDGKNQLLFCHDADGKYLSKASDLTSNYKLVFKADQKDLVSEKYDEELKKWNDENILKKPPKSASWRTLVTAVYNGNNEWFVSLNSILVTDTYTELGKDSTITMIGNKCKRFIY